jgi:ParB-like chromosome segregation protein Spo0J
MGSKSEYTRADYYMIPPEDIWLIGIDTDDGEDHVLVADAINHEPIDDKMVRNFMCLGVMTPIWVRKVKVSTDGPQADGPQMRYECIFGRTRVQGAREANKLLTEQGRPTIKVPCLVKTLEEKMLAMAILSENEMRRSTTPLEKARALQRTYARGTTPEEASIMFGVVPASIERWEKISALAPQVIERLETGKTNATAALVVADLPLQEQAPALDKAIEKARGEGRKHVSGASVKRAAMDDAGHKPLPHKTLRKLAFAETRLGLLHPEAELFLRWLVDGSGEDDVQGLRLLLKAVTEKTPRVKKEQKVVEADTPPRPRGRPRKNLTDVAPKKRGRPRKEIAPPPPTPGVTKRTRAPKKEPSPFGHDMLS